MAERLRVALRLNEADCDTGRQPYWFDKRTDTVIFNIQTNYGEMAVASTQHSRFVLLLTFTNTILFPEMRELCALCTVLQHEAVARLRLSSMMAMGHHLSYVMQLALRGAVNFLFMQAESKQNTVNH